GASSSLQGLIEDNEVPVINLVETDLEGVGAVVVEGGELVFNVSMSEQSTEDVTFTWTLTLGSASADDLTAPITYTDTVTILAGETSAQIKVPTFDDTLFEGGVGTYESVTMTLSNPSGATLGASSSLQGLIEDNEVPVINLVETDLEGVGAVVVEGGELVFNVSMSEQSTEDVTFTWTLTLGSASADDLTAPITYTDTVTILAGETSAQIKVPTFDDTLFEGGVGTYESVTMTLSNPSGATLGASSSLQGLIEDNDVQPVAEPDLYDVTEGDSLDSAADGSINGVLFNDDAGLSVASVSNNSDGSNSTAAGVALVTALGGTVTVYANGEFTYDAPVLDHPLADAYLTDSFYYTASDGVNSAEPVLVSIRVYDTVPLITAVEDMTAVNEAGETVGNWTYNAGADGLSAVMGQIESGINLSFDVAGLGEAFSATREDIFQNDEYQGELLTVSYADGTDSYTYFTLFMKVDGTYKFDLVTPNPTGSEGVIFTSVNGGKDTELWASEAIPNFNGETDIRFTATKNGATDDVNWSSPGIAVDNNLFSMGEALTLEFYEVSDNPSASNDRKEVDVATLVFSFNGSGDDAKISVDVLDENGDVIATVNNVAVTPGSNTIVVSAEDLNIEGFYAVTVKHEGGVNSATGDTVRLTSMDIETALLPDDTHLDFGVEIVDADDDTDDYDFSVDIVTPQVDQLIVGTSNHDVLNSASGNDIIIGDILGSQNVETPEDYNIALLVDLSASMDEPSGTDGLSRLELMQQSLTKLVNDLTSHGGAVNVRLITFGGDVGSSSGFTLSSPASVTALLLAIAGLEAYSSYDIMGGTNYEAALVAAKEWFDGQTGGTPDYENLVLFLTDGDPTFHLDSNGNPTDGGGFNAGSSTSAADLSEAIGAMADLVGQSYTVEVNAIGIGNDVNTDYLQFFDNTSSTGSDTVNVGGVNVSGPVGDVDIVNTAEDLELVLGTTVVVVPQIGDDVLMGTDGNDIIYGDAISADSLGAPYAGNGYQGVVDYLTDTLGHEPSAAEVIAQLRANPLNYYDQVTTEGGDDTLVGGAGDDLLMAGAGDDILIGGQGDDVMYGGQGSDTFVWQAGDEALPTLPATDVVMDFTLGEDVLDLSSLLGGIDPLNISDYLQISSTTVEGVASTQLNISTAGNIAGGVDQVIQLKGIVGVDVDSLLAGPDPSLIV
ncbi:MAG: VWA domain-containing protein, partial [Pseudomonadaceae bacterium]